jgi:pimeloyl-ACP methyl ester carboxylesterase
MPAEKTFVLVHGAWHGGWCWRRVADRLRKQGHRVFTPTLSGLGERSHLLRADIGLADQVDDVVNLMKWEELTDVVLVGHSYGGLVISGVAERMEKAISSIVFLDAFVPESGQAMSDLTGTVKNVIIEAQARGDTTIRPVPAAVFKVNEKDAAWVDKMCTPHPLKCFLDRVTLTGARERIGKKSYILAGAYAGATFVPTHARLSKDPAWKVYDVPCGHDVMLDAPDRLTEILLEVA